MDNKKLSEIDTGSESGFVLVMGLVLTAIIAAMGMTALQSTKTDINITRNQRVSNQLLYAAEAGLDRLSNKVWTDSGLGKSTKVSFDSLDTLSYLMSQLPKKLITSTKVGNTAYFDAAIMKFEKKSDTIAGKVIDKRIITMESRGWIDSNSNGSFDPGEPSKTIEGKYDFIYGSLEFPFGMLTQNTECVFCHLHVNGDVVSLTNMTVKSDAYSVVTGTVYSAGTTNIGGAGVNVAKDYAGTPVSVVSNYTDPRFPLDANGNPAFPKIQNLAYYKGLASSYNGGAGSSISGGVISVVPTGSTYAAGKTVTASVQKSYAGNAIFDGTGGSCLVLSGPVVVDNDVVIKGCVKGTGNIYAGGNIMIAGSVSYTNSATDKLGLVAGGNITFGDYRAAVGGAKFIKKEIGKFNTAMYTSTTISPKRYYLWPDGNVYLDSNGTKKITPGAGDETYGYIPTNNWVTETEYAANLLDTAKGVTRIDSLMYTSNAIFGINKVGSKQTTINGSLVSADIGLLIPGTAGKTKVYDPALVGLTINYDSRMKDFVTIANNPNKNISSWKEVAPGNW